MHSHTHTCTHTHRIRSPRRRQGTPQRREDTGKQNLHRHMCTGAHILIHALAHTRTHTHTHSRTHTDIPSCSCAARSSACPTIAFVGALPPVADSRAPPQCNVPGGALPTERSYSEDE
eukprot:GHVU01121864.1.p1 GENE.GHVU01121864.1~~GHVU01121864.1.p1  ORF type:complete len:118 (-),score=3.67 GHVU01121864.1:118-471(-)